MQTTKKVLLTLICIVSICLCLGELFGSILDVIDPPGYDGDKGIQIIFSGIVTVVFFLAFISSLCGITNTDNGFWLGKIPALIILPFSVPFLIIDFIQSRKPKEIIEETITKEKEFKLLGIVFAISIIAAIVIFIVSIGEIFWNLFVEYIAKKHNLDVSMIVDGIISDIEICCWITLNCWCYLYGT